MSAAKPLSGIRVLDLTWVGVGCIATWLLAEMGAEVVKVEPVDGSDNLRVLPPRVGGVGVNHLVFDRHKKSLPLNLRTPEGQEAFRRVAATCDAVVEGMRSGVADRLGIGADALREVNPALTYVTMPGYGSGGPLSSRAGHDINFDAMAGLLALTWPDGPTPPPVQAADYFGATLAALGVVSGIVQARATGQGATTESSLFDGAMFSMVIPHARALMMDVDVTPDDHMLIGSLACYAVYECADGGALAVGALEPHFWKKFCDMAGIDDEGAQYDPARQAELRKRVAEAMATRTRDEWMEHFGDEDVCVSPVLSIREAVSEPHVRERAGVSSVLHPDGRTLDAPAPPLRALGEQPPARVPAVGEGARELLGEAGYSGAEIDDMVARGLLSVSAAADVSVEGKGT